MKKVFKYASLLFVGTAIMVACSKKEDETPTTQEPTCDGGSVKTKKVTIDNSTSTSTYDKAYTQSINKCDGSAIILLDVKAQKDLDKIYITLSQDNGPSSPFYAPAATGQEPASDTYNKTFTAGSASAGYSLDIPDLGGGLTSSDYIVVPITVPVRNSDAATTDVYTIWITNGSGDFTATGKKTVIGPITVTLNYKGASTTYVSGSATLGDQNATPPSYLTTDGQIGTISGTTLIESTMTDEEKTSALNSADINFVGLSADGSTIGNGQTPYFISVGIRSAVGFTGNTLGTDMTKFGAYTGSKAFADLTAADLSSLAAPTADKIVVENDKIYVFLTQDGRKGVVKTSSLSTAATGKTVNVQVKVLTPSN